MGWIAGFINEEIIVLIYKCGVAPLMFLQLQYSYICPKQMRRTIKMLLDMLTGD